MRPGVGAVSARIVLVAMAALGLVYAYALQQPDSRLAGKLLSRGTRAHRLIARLKKAYDAPRIVRVLRPGYPAASHAVINATTQVTYLPDGRIVVEMQSGGYVQIVEYAQGRDTVKALAETGEVAVPGLVECLDQRRSSRLRDCAASVLGAYGERAAPAVPALIDCLGETDADVDEVESVASVLVRIGDPAVLPLVSRLRDAAVSPLVDRWGHEDYAVRDRVEDALIRIGGPAVVRALTEPVSSEDARLREAAKHTLEHIGGAGS